MRNQKGFYLVELLVVIVIISLILLLVTLTVIKEIDNARGSTLLAEARYANTAAQTVVFTIGIENERVSDSDYMSGLTGLVDDASLPVRTEISRRMATLLAPDVVLSDEPATDAARVVFVVKNGSIISMTYEKFIGTRLFRVTIADGESTVERIK